MIEDLLRKLAETPDDKELYSRLFKEAQRRGLLKDLEGRSDPAYEQAHLMKGYLEEHLKPFKFEVQIKNVVCTADSTSDEGGVQVAVYRKTSPAMVTLGHFWRRHLWEITRDAALVRWVNYMLRDSIRRKSRSQLTHEERRYLRKTNEQAGQ